VATLAMESLTGAVRGVGRALGADRCWLYARDPATASGIALVRWLRAGDVGDVPDDLTGWSTEPADLARRDPLFGRALEGAPADVVDDTAHADVDRAMERALGHRAFIHLNLHLDGALWGVLQPGMTAAPRAWTAVERAELLALRPALAALVAAALENGRLRPPSRREVG
jgi:GAF domain-containing protein